VWRWLAVIWLATTGATTLTVTAPSFQRYVWTSFDPDIGDSVQNVECYVTGDSLRGALMGILMGQPVTGGGNWPVDSLDCRDLKGQVVEFQAPWPGHFYVQWRGDAGISCGTNIAYVPPPDVTSVPVTARDPVMVNIFDVRGRWIGHFQAEWDVVRRRRVIRNERLPSGIYFLRPERATREFLRVVNLK